MDRQTGFTIVELLIVIIVIGILLTIGVVGTSSMLIISRDNTRGDDVASIARKLEQDYTDGVGLVSGDPTYPPADQFVADSQFGTGSASNTDPTMFRAPNASGSSMVSATLANASQPRGSGSPSLNEYVYQPLTTSGTVCNNTAQPCVSFRLFYKRESDSTVVVIRSLHQQ